MLKWDKLSDGQSSMWGVLCGWVGWLVGRLLGGSVGGSFGSLVGLLVGKFV
jgi:hypothetical protein